MLNSQPPKIGLTSHTNPYAHIPMTGPVIKITINIEEVPIPTYLDCGSQLNIGNNELARIVAKQRMKKDPLSTILYPCSVSALGWDKKPRLLTAKLYAKMTINGHSSVVCILIDHQALHTLVLGTPALICSPLQVICEKTGKRYLPKTPEHSFTLGPKVERKEKGVQTDGPTSHESTRENGDPVSVLELTQFLRQRVENQKLSPQLAPIPLKTAFAVNLRQVCRHRDWHAVQPKFESDSVKLPIAVAMAVEQPQPFSVQTLLNQTHHSLDREKSTVENKGISDTTPSVHQVLLINRVKLLGEESKRCLVRLDPPLKQGEQIMFTPDNELLEKKGLMAPDALLEVDGNLQSQIVIDHPGSLVTDLGVGERVGSAVTCSVIPDHLVARQMKFLETTENMGTEVRLSQVPIGYTRPLTGEERREKLTTYLHLEHLTPKMQKKVTEFLLLNNDSFSLSDTDMGDVDLIKHTIDTREALPQKLPLRRVPFKIRDKIEAVIRDLLASGVIRPSKSPWSSPIVPVLKKDGSLRMCVDYRALNRLTRKDQFPLPRIDDLVDAVGRIKPIYFSKTDCQMGFHQMQMHPNSVEKTAFSCGNALYEYNRLPFGLCNAPASYQRLMQLVLQGMDPDRVFVYLDDILIISESIEIHQKLLSQLLYRLQEVGLKLNPKKCEWYRSEVIYLGFQLSKDGIHTDPDKIKDLKQWEQPKNVHDVRSFLGFASYYRRFIHNFAKIATPLHHLLKDETQWDWDSNCVQAFKTLCARLITAPVLAYPRFDEPFFLETDASKKAIAAVLCQKDAQGAKHPIGYASRTTVDYEKNYGSSELECLALVYGIKQFRVYLFQQEVTVVTDHGALTCLNSARDLPGRLHRWALQIQEINPKIVYRSGKTNGNADALSRREKPVPESETWTPQELFDLCGFSATEQQLGGQYTDIVETVPMAPYTVASLCKATDHEFEPNQTITNKQLISNVPENPKYVLAKNEQRLDPFIDAMCQFKLLGKITGHVELASSIPGQAQWFTVINGLLYYDKSLTNEKPLTTLPLVVPRHLREQILSENHGISTSGHFGFNKVYSNMKSHYFWHNMKGDVKTWVRSCTACAYRKGNALQHMAPLLSIPIPEKPWQLIAIDLVSYPVSNHYNKYALIAIDHCSKYCAAIPLQNKHSTTVIEALEMVIATLGQPETILSDNGGEFVNRRFQALLRRYNIEHKTTTPLHPKGNGSAERMVQIVSNMLAKVVDRKAQDWDLYLYRLVWAYNRTIQDSTGMRPYDLMFGRAPNLTGASSLAQIPALNFQVNDDMLADSLVQQYYLDKARRQAEQSKERQKSTYDKNNSTKSGRFSVGDQVLLFNPQVTSHKLSAMYTGPFVILEITGNNAMIELCGEPNVPKRKVSIDRLSLCYPYFPHVTYMGYKDEQVPNKQTFVSDTPPSPPDIELGGEELGVRVKKETIHSHLNPTVVRKSKYYQRAKNKRGIKRRPKKSRKQSETVDIEVDQPLPVHVPLHKYGTRAKIKLDKK